MSIKENEQLPSVEEIVQTTTSPHVPIYCIRPNTIISTAKTFISSFKNGRVLYAVKCNTHQDILKALWKGGVRHFLCSTLKECETIRELFGSEAGIHFLFPVKAPEDIAEAYNNYAVKTFGIDSVTELEKILSTIQENDHDVTLMIQLAVPAYTIREKLSNNRGLKHFPLLMKLGIENIDEAAKLIRLARSKVKHLGVSFHVGSQCTNLKLYTQALEHVRDVIAAADVPIDIINVGGGFPIRYSSDTNILTLQEYFNTIQLGLQILPTSLTQNAQLWCVSGRALVGACGSLVIRVEDRRLNGAFPALYVNDGIFGNLHEAGEEYGLLLPMRLIRHSEAELSPFALYGPTCDSIDYMAGPFQLASDVEIGDHIEVGQLGAYSCIYRSQFNGFNRCNFAFVRDEPMLQTPGHSDSNN